MCHNAITHNTDSAVGQSTLDPRSAHVCRSCVSWLKLTNVSYTLPVDTGHTMTVSSTGQRQKDDLWDLQRKHIPFQAALSYSYKVASAPAEIWVFEEFVVVSSVVALRVFVQLSPAVNPAHRVHEFLTASLWFSKILWRGEQTDIDTSMIFMWIGCSTVFCLN